jgi:protocatechuate 3,4-dioxygenase beta subunit
MPHWGKDILLSGRGLIACAAGLVVGQATNAGLISTPPQTAGPFYPHTKPDDTDSDLTRITGASAQASGEIIDITGRILSVKGHALRGAVVEIWQADVNGRYFNFKDRILISSRDSHFQGYGAVRAGKGGAYRFRTIRPAAYGSGSFRRTPHVHFRVVDEKLGELVTQMYFPNDPRNQKDVLYLSLSGDLARAAVTARKQLGEGMQRYAFDLVLA